MVADELRSRTPQDNTVNTALKLETQRLERQRWREQQQQQYEGERDAEHEAILSTIKHLVIGLFVFWMLIAFLHFSGVNMIPSHLR
jgi:hypothetical protein